MAWADLSAKIDDIMQHTLTFQEAPQLFSVEIVPETRADKTYCLVGESINPNTEFTDKADRFYPLNGFRLSVIFELGANSTTQRELAESLIESAIGTIINPANRSSLTRQVHFLGANSKLFQPEGFWQIWDIRFQAEYILNY